MLGNTLNPQQPLRLATSPQSPGGNVVKTGILPVLVLLKIPIYLSGYASSPSWHEGSSVFIVACRIFF